MALVLHEVIIVFRFSVALTGPYSQLAPKPPLVALASPGPITSLIVQTLLSIAFQTFMFFFIQWQPWLVRRLILFDVRVKLFSTIRLHLGVDICNFLTHSIVRFIIRFMRVSSRSVSQAYLSM